MAIDLNFRRKKVDRISSPRGILHLHANFPIHMGHQADLYKGFLTSNQVFDNPKCLYEI
jgi:hypothetical protein